MTQQEILDLTLRITEYTESDEWIELHRDTMREVIRLAYVAGERAAMVRERDRLQGLAT